MTHFVVLCLLSLSLSWVIAPSWQSTWAQEVPPAEGEAPPPAESGATPAPKSGGSPNMLVHMIKSVGLVMGIILGTLQISMVALIVLLFMDLRMGDSVPPGFVEEFTETVNKRRFKEAYELARQDNSFLARVLVAGMSRLQYGIEDARETAMNTVESIKAGKEQLTTYLATIGSLGPLIGLVGTVYSMIGAFMKMSDPNNPAKPHEMADTLSHGLVVTLIGIGLAVPAIFFHTFFRNRLMRISMEAANVADDLLTQMYHNSRKAVATAVPADSRGTTATAVKPAE
jgi:biopolymer transport protein ExbB